MDRTVTAMAEYGAPEYNWDYAIEHTCYTTERTHVPVETMKTSYEMVFQLKPDVSNLVHFYSPGVYHLTKDERKLKSLAYKAEPCRMLGYSSKSKNTYILLNTRRHKTFERRDVIFGESCYQALVSAEKIDSNLDKLKELFTEHGFDLSEDDPEDQNLVTNDDLMEDGSLEDNEYGGDDDEEEEQEEEEELDVIPQRTTRFRGVSQQARVLHNVANVEVMTEKDPTIEGYKDYVKSLEEA
jgi:hypothetical protein